MPTPKSILLDNDGMLLILTAAQADELQLMFMRECVRCTRKTTPQGEELRFPDSDQLPLVNAVFQTWRRNRRRSRH